MSNSAKLCIKLQEEDGPKHPNCPHGPTLLFFQSNGGEDDFKSGYFACSAFRDSKDCSFRLKYNQFDESKSHESYAGALEVVPLPSLPVRDRNFCCDCKKGVFKAELGSHHGHNLLKRISDELLADPTAFLNPLSNDKAEAQYFFDKKTLEFLGGCFESLGIRKVVCIGAPRLHFYLKNACKSISSILLDMDDRFEYLCADLEYEKFNMCNNYFFGGERSVKNFENFLKSEKVLLFTDPPFACRTEPIAATIKAFNRTYNKVNSVPAVLPVFWVFPYYFETYITQSLAEMAMSDYRVNYTNHELFSDGAKGREFGSPIRVFTNIELSRLKLPEGEGYRFCQPCKVWTSKGNAHCRLCKRCPSKSGHVYRHCAQCGKCVKPNYEHCIHCRRCAQKAGHVCRDYQRNLHCWICRRKGHCEWNCARWLDGRKLVLRKMSKVIFCLLCGRKGHNELECSRRRELLQESQFMGEFVNVFSEQK